MEARPQHVGARRLRISDDDPRKLAARAAVTCDERPTASLISAVQARDPRLREFSPWQASYSTPRGRRDEHRPQCYRRRPDPGGLAVSTTRSDRRDDETHHA